MDYYEILGISRSASKEEIDSAYREKARQNHPDLNPDNIKESTEKFKKISEAYEVLGDPKKKTQYDLGGNPFQVGSSFHGGDPFDVINNFFGMRRGPVRDKGRDVKKSITITFEESIRGCSKEIKLDLEEKCSCNRGYKNWNNCKDCGGSGHRVIQQNPWVLQTDCPTCRGQGKIPADLCEKCQGQGFVKSKEETISVSVPAGIENGLQLRMVGLGQPGITGQRGSLFVEVLVESHPFWTRKGIDIICKVPITYSQLVLGDKITIPSLSGKTEINIPPGTDLSKKLRLRGIGSPSLKNNSVGDMIVSLHLEVPKIEGDKYRSLLEQLKEMEKEFPSEYMKKFNGE